MALKHIFAVCLIVLLAGNVSARAREAGNSEKVTPALRTFTLTEDKVRTFGAYTAVETPVLKSGDTLHIYGEPEDFGWHTAEGVARFNVEVSIDLRRRDGRHLDGRPATTTLKHEAATRPPTFFFSLGLTLTAGVGAYKARVRLRDAVTGQIVEKSFAFAVAHERRPPAVRIPVNTVAAAQDGKPAAPAAQPAKPLECRKYFSQIGATISVPCEP
jgi:hypothetical protein